ncbi:hypothetical protein AVEN_244398-1 [Araneus ventricosus]|uniref:Indolethylamine N-methyltransferase n=1 Tax=Araneus ventricosus TaxID=182803 RepID=A0A4Y2IM56_ARAVE|nr:hypothetical protein AVEN_244398-1 [Araneus ventricosus]
MAEEVVKQNFKENLKAIEYHEELHGILRTLHIYFEITASFIYDVLKSRRFEGKKLLEVGSGATVHSIASASAYFPIIVQSDFVEDNLENLKLWHKGQSPLDWSAFLDIVASLEDFKSDVQEVRAKLESRIRKSVKAIVHCDFLKDGVLKLEEVPAEASPPYDLIIAVQCLEVPCGDLESFVNVLKRLKKLLRKGGGLILSSFHDCEEWEVRKKKFPHLKISLKEIVAALDKAGFGNHDVKRFSPLVTDYNLTYGGYYCIATEAL